MNNNSTSLKYSLFALHLSSERNGDRSSLSHSLSHHWLGRSFFFILFYPFFGSIQIFTHPHLPRPRCDVRSHELCDDNPSQQHRIDDVSMAKYVNWTKMKIMASCIWWNGDSGRMMVSTTRMTTTVTKCVSDDNVGVITAERYWMSFAYRPIYKCPIGVVWLLLGVVGVVIHCLFAVSSWMHSFRIGQCVLGLLTRSYSFDGNISKWNSIRNCLWTPLRWA